ncbi:MAG: hypothetical protein H6741_02025 [Alphaproteobacteria bacterium]|nr:hypothetical protein [Alphaproteobacteria bacterium]MCB9791481.1 hypothetical protein [Alphaproteobacteria bacterium]
MHTLLLLLLACAPSADLVEDPGDGFGDAQSVRIRAPANGATLDGPVTLRFQVGAEVSQVRLFGDDEALTGFEDPGAGTLTVELEPGRHVLELVGYDDRRAELSSAPLQVRVVAPEVESWVGIMSPSDGSHPINPVQFVVEASDEVVSIEITADGWSLGEVAPGESLGYRFSGTGYVREIEATGFDASGEALATDHITITPEAGAEAPDSEFNALILDLAASYPQDGTYAYYWPSTGSWSGSTRDLWYQGERVADDGGYSACYCSGITWELYLRAWQEYEGMTGGDPDDLNGMFADDVREMRRDWYVRDLYGPGPSVALEAYGLGYEVQSFDDYQPGDFIQFWRTSGSGHTAVFMGWEYDDDGSRSGIRYLSCQGSTDGYGVNAEYFGSFNGAIDPVSVYVGRAAMPVDWF